MLLRTMLEGVGHSVGAARSGATEVIVKPFEFEQLVGAMRRAFTL